MAPINNRDNIIENNLYRSFALKEALDFEKEMDRYTSNFRNNKGYRWVNKNTRATVHIGSSF